ncbi:MAG: MaoC family dehydratase [Chloroflexota bacterium]
MTTAAAIAQMTPDIGTETSVSDWYTITQEKINLFADATGDHQWIHTDPEKAQRESPYKTTIAHGYFSLSLIPHLTGAVNPDKPRFEDAKLSINYGTNKVRFPSPVPVGARVRARTKLVSVDEVKNNGVHIVNEVTIEIEGSNKPGCVAETVSRIYF